MDKDKPFLNTPPGAKRWDWWSENPVELVLVAFILVVFFMMPREGCGISAEGAGEPVEPAILDAVE